MLMDIFVADGDDLVNEIPAQNARDKASAYPLNLVRRRLRRQKVPRYRSAPRPSP